MNALGSPLVGYSWIPLLLFFSHNNKLPSKRPHPAATGPSATSEEGRGSRPHMGILVGALPTLPLGAERWARGILKCSFHFGFLGVGDDAGAGDGGTGDGYGDIGVTGDDLGMMAELVLVAAQASAGGWRGGTAGGEAVTEVFGEYLHTREATSFEDESSRSLGRRTGSLSRDELLVAAALAAVMWGSRMRWYPWEVVAEPRPYGLRGSTRRTTTKNGGQRWSRADQGGGGRGCGAKGESYGGLH